MTGKTLRHIPVVKAYCIVVPVSGTSMCRFFYGMFDAPKGVANYPITWEKVGSKWLGTVPDKTYACQYQDIDQARKSVSYLNELMGRVDTPNHPGCFVTEWYK